MCRDFGIRGIPSELPKAARLRCGLFVFTDYFSSQLLRDRDETFVSAEKIESVGFHSLQNDPILIRLGIPKNHKNQKARL